MIFNPSTRTRRVVAGLLAAGLLGGGVAGAAGAAHGTSPPNPAANARAAIKASTVPTSVTRAETAAEDVIGFLEQGKLAKSRAEARILRTLARGPAAQALRDAGVTQRQIAEFQHRADRTARLSLSGATATRVSLAANAVSQLMPGFYAHYQDPVPSTVLRLDYLDREIQLQSQAGNRAKTRAAVKQLKATWAALRPELVGVGGIKVARAYDQHVRVLTAMPAAKVVQKEAVHGLNIVDQMETVFLGK